MNIFLTAISRFDYTFTSSDVTFSFGSTDSSLGCVNITILDDAALDGNKAFTVTLTTSDPDVLLGNSLTVITIVDDDSTLIAIGIVRLISRSFL